MGEFERIEKLENELMRVGKSLAKKEYQLRMARERANQLRQIINLTHPLVSHLVLGKTSLTLQRVCDEVDKMFNDSTAR